MKGEALKQDKTIFCDLFGYSPETKILELLLEGRELEYTLNDIIKSANVNRKRAYQILNFYAKKGIIQKSKQIKHLNFYKINTQRDDIKLLEKLFDKMIKNN